MRIIKNDIILFYELHNRLNEVSPNIGIIGTEREFKIRIREILRDLKKNKICYESMLTRNNGRQVTIFIDGREYTYINIDCMNDLQGRYFCKYII